MELFIPPPPPEQKIIMRSYAYETRHSQLAAWLKWQAAIFKVVKLECNQNLVLAAWFFFTMKITVHYFVHQFDRLSIKIIWWKSDVKLLRNYKVININLIFVGRPDKNSTTWFFYFLYSYFHHNFVNICPFDVKFSPDDFYGEAIKLIYKWTHILMMNKYQN